MTKLEGIDAAITRLKSKRARGIVGPCEAVALLKELRREILDEDAADAKGRPGSDEWYRERARGRYVEEGRVEIDDEAPISKGTDPGAYVQA